MLSGSRSALLVSNTTPGSLISSLNEQPTASTRSPFGRVGALVCAVDHAVTVAVELAAFLVDLRARGRIGALVAAVADAIAVAVELAAAGIDLGAGGRARALVDVVGHAVAVIILRQRAAVAIHRRAGRRARAFVRVVGDAVAVGVDARGARVCRPSEYWIPRPAT